MSLFVFLAETSCAMRWFCGAGRGFVYSVKDNNGMASISSMLNTYMNI